MEKKQRFYAKSLIICDFDEDLNKNLQIIDCALEKTLKEIKIYFISLNDNEEKKTYSYEYYEKLLTFLYNYVEDYKFFHNFFKTFIVFRFFKNNRITSLKLEFSSLFFSKKILKK